MLGEHVLAFGGIIERLAYTAVYLPLYRRICEQGVALRDPVMGDALHSLWFMGGHEQGDLLEYLQSIGSSSSYWSSSDSFRALAVRIVDPNDMGGALDSSLSQMPVNEVMQVLRGAARRVAEVLSPDFSPLSGEKSAFGFDYADLGRLRSGLTLSRL